MYVEKMKKRHKNFKIFSTGTKINPKWPWLSASDDGRISCDCHGEGIIEIKCPWSVKDLKIGQIDKPNFYIA